MISEIEADHFPETRLRFAPSPTGYLHVGGARTALFNYLFAKSCQGKFILRIEDTDQERSTQQATEQVLASMKWLGLDWDEGPNKIEESEELTENKGDYGPYFQSQRLDIYQAKLDELLTYQKIYSCFCSDEELNMKRKQAEAMGIPYIYDRKCLELSEKLSEEEIKIKKEQHPWVYRFKVPHQEILFEDQIKGKIKFDTKLIGDFVIRKSDGFPTYNFAVVVDDAMMKISHIIRGDDHISNTPRQLLLYKALSQPIPKFYHISMILGKDGDKLSKRYGSISVLDYQKAGYYPDPLINHLALLGWSPQDGIEVITRSNLEKAFINPKFSSSPAIFDEEKLSYLNGLYIRNLPQKTILADFKKILTKKGYSLDHPKLDDILLHLCNYCRKLNDIEIHYTKFMDNTVDENLLSEEKEWLQKETSKRLFSLAYEIFNGEESDFIKENEFKILIASAKEKGIKGKDFFMPLRIKLTGEIHGMELDIFLSLKFRKEILHLLKT